MLNLEKFSKLLSSKKIQIPKPLDFNSHSDFLSQIPKFQKKLAEQTIQDVEKHGYKPIRFISKCKYGFVFSASKGRVRYAIKVQQIVIKGEDDYINLVDRYRNSSEALNFYYHPHLLQLIECFETNDNYYTVSEECICNLQEFMNQIKDKTKKQSCLERYAVQLLGIFEYLSIGPIDDNSNRFISHVKPSDVLISYDTSIRLNPSFGKSLDYLGAIPFCDSDYSVLNQNITCERRFRKSLAHLLMFMTGLSDKQILISEINQCVGDFQDVNQSSAQLILVNSFIDKKSYSSYNYYSEAINFRNLYEFNECYYSVGKVERYLKMELEKLNKTHFDENNQTDYIQIRKNRIISLHDYQKIYEISRIKLTEEQEDDFQKELDIEKRLIHQKKRIREFLHQKLGIKDQFPTKFLPRKLSRSIEDKLCEIFYTTVKLHKSYYMFSYKLNRFLEEKKDKNEIENKSEDSD